MFNTVSAPEEVVYMVRQFVGRLHRMEVHRNVDLFCFYHEFSSIGSAHPDLQSGGSAVRARQLPQVKGSLVSEPFFMPFKVYILYSCRSSAKKGKPVMVILSLMLF
jgi:hypothetical protein